MDKMSASPTYEAGVDKSGSQDSNRADKCRVFELTGMVQCNRQSIRHKLKGVLKCSFCRRKCPASIFLYFLPPVRAPTFDDSCETTYRLDNNLSAQVVSP